MRVKEVLYPGPADPVPLSQLGDRRSFLVGRDQCRDGTRTEASTDRVRLPSLSQCSLTGLQVRLGCSSVDLPQPSGDVLVP